MTKEDLTFIKKVFDANLAGYYNPQQLTKSYQLITGDMTLVPLVRKRMALNSFVNLKYKELMKSYDETELAVEPEKVDNPTHTEEVELTKPKATKKKRVYKKRKNAS